MKEQADAIKAKGVELIEKFMTQPISYRSATNCAIIAVEEIIPIAANVYPDAGAFWKDVLNYLKSKQ